jgi:hypothetical protein
MSKFKMLYKAMYDDLKDADMLSEYACELREKHPEDKSLADELMKYAKYRLEHFMEFHKLFVTEAKKTADSTHKTKVDECLWEVTHENLQEWEEGIAARIKKY